jgi:drug/metabolite transporter (DMT)-like permease
MGVTCIAKPALLLSTFGMPPIEAEGNFDFDVENRTLGIVCGIVCAFMYGAEAIGFRSIGDKLNSLVLTHYFNVYSTVMFVLYMNFDTEWL